MNTLVSAEDESSIARSIAPEDLRCGDFVAVLDVFYEFPSFFWCCEPQLMPPHEVVRLRFRSADSGRPLKIKSICLPFLLVKTPERSHETIDVRGCRLVRLTERYGQSVWKAVRRRSSPARR